MGAGNAIAKANSEGTDDLKYMEGLISDGKTKQNETQSEQDAVRQRESADNGKGGAGNESKNNTGNASGEQISREEFNTAINEIKRQNEEVFKSIRIANAQGRATINEVQGIDEVQERMKKQFAGTGLFD